MKNLRFLHVIVFILLMTMSLSFVSCNNSMEEIKELYAAYQGDCGDEPLKYVAPPIVGAKLSKLDDEQMYELLTAMGVDIRQTQISLVRSYVESFEVTPDYCKPIMINAALNLYTENRLRKAVKLFYGTMTEEQANKVSLCLLPMDTLLSELKLHGVEFSRENMSAKDFEVALRVTVLNYEMLPQIITPVSNSAEYKETAYDLAQKYGNTLLNAVRAYNGMSPLSQTE